MGELQGLPQTATWALKEELESRGFYVSDTIKGQDYYLKDEIRALKALVREMVEIIRKHVELGSFLFYMDGSLECNRPYYTNLSTESLKCINSKAVQSIMEVK